MAQELSIQQTNRPANKLSETDLIALNNILMMKAEEEGQHNPNDWILGGQVAPLYSYRNLSSDYLSDKEIRELNNSENGIMAYSGGIALAFAPGKRISVQSGIFYSKYGQEKTDLEMIAYNQNQYSDKEDLRGGLEMAITNSTGTITDQVYKNNEMANVYFISRPDAEKDIMYLPNTSALSNSVESAEDLTAIQYFEYFEVPLNVRYKIVDRKLDFNLMGGISTNFLFGNTVKIDNNGDKYDYGSTDNITRINYCSSFGFGFEYPVFSKVLVNLEPRFRYYLNPLDKNANIDVHPYSMGIFAGISFVF